MKYLFPKKIINLIILSFIFYSSCGKIELPHPQVKVGSRYPSLAATTEGGLLMSWFEPVDSLTMSIKFSEFSGGVWSKPQLVIQARPFFVNWADFPSIFQHKGDTLALYWPEKSASGTYDYDVKVVFSTDRGLTWSEPVIPHRDGVNGEHGFVSFYNDLDNKLGLVWLDGRHMSNGHEGGDYGEMNLYVSGFSSDLDLERELQMDPRVCECCPTSAVTTDNAIIIAYRDRSPDETRDINILRFADGNWQAPYPVNNDNWQIAGCPVNGPALDANGSQVAIAWYTAPDGKPQVNVAFSNDDGATFEKPIQVDKGQSIGRVDLKWLGKDAVLASWIETGDETTNILARVVHKNGSINPVYVVSKIDPGRVSGCPKIGLSDSQIFFTWTESGENGRIQSTWIRRDEFRYK